MTFAKGVTSGYMPIGGVMVGDRVAQVLIEHGGEFNHGYTYCGHPVACAVALANLRLIQRERLVERVHDDIGPYLAERFAALAEHPLVGETQTCGLMASLQLVADKANSRSFDPEARCGDAVPRPLLRDRRRHACRGRPDDHRPAARDHTGADRRDDQLIRTCLDKTAADLRRRGLA